MKNLFNRLIFCFCFLVSELIGSKAHSQIYFSNLQSYFLGCEADVTISADFNNDGLCDLAITTGSNSVNLTNNYSLVILYQDVHGQLNIPQRLYYATAGVEATTIDSGDFNNDQLTDIVLGHGDSISIFFQGINGINSTRTSYFNGGRTESLKAGDLNNDGLIDIVACNNGESYIRAFYQDSAGFTSQTYYADLTHNREIEVADVNGDGRNDVVMIAGYLYYGIRVYLQNATGELDSAIIYNTNAIPSLYLSCIATDDINNDGLIDVVGAGGGNVPDAKTIIWYQDPVTHLLQTPINLPAYHIPDALEIADLDNDGKKELVLLHGGWSSLSIYEQDASNNYSTYGNLYYPLNTSHFKNQGLCINDVDHNGRMDIIVADYNSYVSVYYGDSVLTNGFHNVRKDPQMELYPNPVTDKIRITQSGFFKNIHVRISDVRGSIINEENLVSKEIMEMSVHDLSPGFYILEIEDDVSKVTKKFIKD